MSNLADLTIREAADGLRAKAFSAFELLAAVCARSDAHEETLNSFITETRSMAETQASDVDRRLAAGEQLPTLAGIPIAVKDVLTMADVATTAGSAILRTYVAPYSATAVTKLLDQSAVIVGKTNCDEFALGASGENSAYGASRNPWDTTRVPGGSSSGSATAVAAGQALGALGSDTGGSVRQPAAFTNLVGLKPTYGRVSRYGLLAAASSLDTVGVFGRSVDDAGILLKAIAGQDPCDATSSAEQLELPDFSSVTIDGMRIGVPKQFFVDGMDEELKQCVLGVIEELKSRGAVIVDVDIPSTVHALPAYYIVQPAEVSSNLARYDGIRYGVPVRESGDTLIDQYTRTRQAGFGDEVKRRILTGTYVLSAGYVDAYYTKAQKVRMVITREYKETLANVDCLIGPTTPTPAFAIGEKYDDPVTMYLSDILTVASNITGLPALSVPGGFVHGLPVGVQIIARHYDEATMLRVGHVVEAIAGASSRRPPLTQKT